MEDVTVDTIINYFRNAVMRKIPLSTDIWMDGALKLNILLSDEYDKMAYMEQNCAVIESTYLEGGMTSAKAKTFLRASQESTNLNKQKGRVKVIEEFVRLSKRNASLKMEEMKNNL